MHSNVQTKGFIYVRDKKGLIVGGECYAYKGIEANILGNNNFLPTMVTNWSGQGGKLDFEIPEGKTMEKRGTNRRD